MTEIIKTERLIIKPFSPEDSSALAELLLNDQIKKTYMIPDFDDTEKLNKLIGRLMDYSHSDAHFERGIYADGYLIGFVNDVEIDGGDIELGYVIHPARHNHGYATEMLAAVINELLSDDFTRVVTGAFVDNHASIRVMEKCGMLKIDKEEDISYRGVERHCVYYAIEKTVI